jgi:hypothetical protein
MIVGTTVRDVGSGPAAWVSRDGQTWAETGPIPSPSPSEGCGLADLVATAAGWVAAGGCSSPAGRAEPFVVVSADGRLWRAAEVDRIDLGDQGDQRLGTLAAAPSGLVLAGDAAGRGVAWWSREGLVWHPSEISGTLAAGVQVAGSRPGFVATGSELDGARGTWVSADGSTWEGPFAPPDQHELVAPAGTPEGFVALSISDEGTQTAWSTDGRTWKSRVAAPAGLMGLFTGDAGLYGFGRRADNVLGLWWTRDGTAWVDVATATVDEQPIWPFAATELDDRVVVVATREIPDPTPDIIDVLPPEVVVWSVTIGR